MLRMTLWTLVGVFGCLYVFGSDLTPDEQAAWDARRADRPSVTAMVQKAFSDDNARRMGGYVPTLAELEAQRSTSDEQTLVASLDATPDALIRTATSTTPADTHSTTTVSDPTKLVALLQDTTMAAPAGQESGMRSADAEDEREAEPDMILRTVTGRRVNVRQGPSTSYDVVGQVIEAEIVRVVSDPQQDWVKILVEGDGVEGYMSTRFLAELPE